MTFGACHAPTRQTPPGAEDPFAVRRELVFGEFQHARLYAPREPAMTGVEFDMAPLVIQESVGGSDDASVKPLSASPVVYWATSSQACQGVDYEQVTYFWTCPYLAPLSNAGNQAIRWIRVTVGQDGFPAVWELGGENVSTNLLFVSKSLEEAARNDFGQPLPGRSFATEPPLDEKPDTAVLGIVEDGPIPLGSYFYVAVKQCTVTSVLCRCSPSKVEDILGSIYYDLEPLEPGTIRPPESKRLTELLRWPRQP